MKLLTPSLLPALLLATLTTPVLAQSQLTPAQREALFRARVDLERRSHAGRIAILQEADRCVAAATTRAAFQACERQEKDARQRFRSEMQAEIQALRSRFGLPPRQGREVGAAIPQGATP